MEEPGTAWNHTLRGDFLWTNVNFGEAVTEPMTPLAWSVLELTLADWSFLPGYASAGNIGGRPYINFSVSASLWLALGRSRQDLAEMMEGTLYMRLPEDMEIPLIPLSRWQVLSGVAKAARIQMRYWRGVRALPTYPATNAGWCRAMRDRIQARATGRDLVELWRGEIAPHVKATVWTVLGTAKRSSDYTMGLRRELVALVGAEDANRLIANVSDEHAPVASLGPLVGLAQVARGQMSRETYLERYGHRGPHEFEISLPRPAEEPDWLERQLTRYRASPADIEALLAGQRQAFGAAWQRLQSRHPGKAKALHRRIVESARRARQREEARSEYVRDRWLVRSVALRAGELTGLGDDIFFLGLDEMLALLDGRGTASDDIPARRETYQRYKALPSYPPIIRGRFDPFEWAADPRRRTDIYDASVERQALDVGVAKGGDPSVERQALDVGVAKGGDPSVARATPPAFALALDAPHDDGPEVIHGAPGSAGVVEGVVRRLDRAEDGDQLGQGEVLVTMMTDIAWTPLFPRAVAVVTDVGAPLSHAAIVARELGIPAVVGCGDATMHLRTGDRVRVDGSQGTVTILERV
jgi:pyruvate,water dikinase